MSSASEDDNRDECNHRSITNLKLDPFERFHEARGFEESQENRSWTLAAADAQVAAFIKSPKDYPPRQKSIDFNIDAMVEGLKSPAR